MSVLHSTLQVPSREPGQTRGRAGQAEMYDTVVLSQAFSFNGGNQYTEEAGRTDDNQLCRKLTDMSINCQQGLK